MGLGLRKKSFIARDCDLKTDMCDNPHAKWSHQQCVDIDPLVDWVVNNCNDLTIGDLIAARIPTHVEPATKKLKVDQFVTAKQSGLTGGGLLSKKSDGNKGEELTCNLCDPCPKLQVES